MSPFEQCPPLNKVLFFEKFYYIKKEHYSSFCTFEIASLANVLGHYLWKYGNYAKPKNTPSENILPHSVLYENVQQVSMVVMNNIVFNICGAEIYCF